MKGVGFAGAVFDDPVFDRALLDGNVGVFEIHVEDGGGIAFEGDEIFRLCAGSLQVGAIFGEIELSDVGRAKGDRPVKCQGSFGGESGMGFASGTLLAAMMLAMTRAGFTAPSGPVSWLRLRGRRS